jgi:integrase/recombinase XerD
MPVQRVLMPHSGAEPWTVLGDDDAPVEPAERWLAYPEPVNLGETGRS